MRYLPPARAIFLTGFMGTGKSTTGQRLARELDLQFVDTDDVVEDIAGKTIPQVFDDDGEEAFREIETEALKRVVQGARKVIATGGGMMLRSENVSVMRQAGPIFCLEASPRTIYSRTRHRDDRPLLQCAAPMQRIRQLLQQRASAYAQSDYTIRTDSGDREETLNKIEKLLRADARANMLATRASRIRVRPRNGDYHIHISHGALGRLDRLCPAPADGLRCVIVTTDNIEPLYAERVVSGLTAGGWRHDVVAVADGEGSKNLQTAQHLYDRLVEAGVDTGGVVFALGGGMVGDLAGFVAATYRRGIGLCQLPTSLLAQVDASSGGKVAVNHERGKNLIGTFYQPAGVVIDPETLQTLPEREFRCGLAEIIKHAVIADSDLFEYLEAELDEFVGLDSIAVRYVLARNCQIKARVVERDPLDKGERACLNYGHTVGHAIERSAGDWQVHHGEAVSIGMVAEARLAQELGICSEEVADRQRELLRRAGLPVSVPAIDLQAALKALRMDKKIAAGSLRMPLVREIGKVELRTDVPITAVSTALRTVFDGA